MLNNFILTLKHNRIGALEHKKIRMSTVRIRIGMNNSSKISSNKHIEIAIE